MPSPPAPGSRRSGRRAAATLRWAGDPEGGAPFVEASPTDPDVGGRLRRRDRGADRARARARAASSSSSSTPRSTSRWRAATPTIGSDGIEDTPARRAAMAVTIPYYEFSEVLSVRDADRDTFRTLDDLAGRRVATLGGTIAYEILLRAQREHGITPVSYDDDVHPYSDLVLGRVDAVLLDNVLAERRKKTIAGFTTSRTASPPATTSACSRRERARCATASTRSCARRCATARSSASSASGRCGTTTSRALYRRVLAGESIAPIAGPGFEDAGARTARGGRSRWPTCRRSCAPRSITIVLSCLSMAARGGARRPDRERPRLRLRPPARRAHRLRRADARHAAPAPAVRPLLRHRGRHPPAGLRRRRCSASPSTTPPTRARSTAARSRRSRPGSSKRRARSASPSARC